MMLDSIAESVRDYLDRSPDGRIHGMFDSTGTVTGRLSCSNPNLMTIPKPDWLPEVRKAFYLANEPGHERLGFDLASAELWVTASITGDLTLTAILQEGRDMHTEMAMLAFGQAEGRWRTLAKNVNYGMAYGAGVAQLSLYAAKAGLDPEAARRAAFKVRDANHSMFAKQHAVADYLTEKAEELGKLPLHDPGRYRHFKSPGVHVEFYTAPNALVQGGVAEYVKDVMLEINNDMRSFQGALALTALLAIASTGWAIQPTVSRPPTYWSCQDNLNSRVVVTFLDTDPPSAILTRGDQRVTATLQKGASGSKDMGSGGVLFWIKGNSALVEWPAGTSYSCASLD